MTRKRTSAADPCVIRFVVITMDNHLGGVVERARQRLTRELPGLELSLHASADWENDPDALAACKRDIARADIVFANMLFLEDQIRAVLPELEARREHCDALVGCLSGPEIIRLTRLGEFRMDRPERGVVALLKRLRGSKGKNQSSGAKQMALLRRLPKLLRLIPGTAQDVRAYFLVLQYWLAGSDENIANLIRFLVNRYASGARSSLRGALQVDPPIEYPDNGIYHPDLPERIIEDPRRLEKLKPAATTVGVLVMRSYVLAGDTAHYDQVIRSLEARGHRVVPVFASGLDSRPAIERFFVRKGQPTIDALLSLTGFSLVGGPAFNDSAAAQDVLSELDVPYISAQAIEFQTLDQWEDSARGLMPVESTIMVAIPELDGATGPMVFGGRRELDGGLKMAGVTDRIEMLTERVHRLVKLRKTPRADRNLAVVLFNFPPNSGATGTAAFLAVFESVFNTLKGLRDAGYTVELPKDAKDLHDQIVHGNAGRFGTDANVCHRVAVDDHVRREPHLDAIESQWGAAPGRQLTDGRSLFVQGAHFGRVFVGIQPGFGYEGDPMRLLFEAGFAPTHAFSAFYRYVREDFDAHALLHFGTHGALEFMPGKQTGLSGSCWPDRLIGSTPSFYLYAANNPSEGTIAKRRAAATLLSYMTPPLTQAGLYRGLLDLKDSLQRYRTLGPDEQPERDRLIPAIHALAVELDLIEADSLGEADLEAHVSKLLDRIHEYESTLIPHGLHVVGRSMQPEMRQEYLESVLDGCDAAIRPSSDGIAHLIRRGSVEEVMVMDGLPSTDASRELLEQLRVMDAALCSESELDGIVHALDGGFIRPSPGGDLLHNPEILPTGRNIHGFDPFRIPTAFATRDGALQAERLLSRHASEGHEAPSTVAMVLWGTDNLKSGGGPIAQALALMGAKPRFDSYGRLAGADLIGLEELGRPRIDVVMTLSGIFRDLFPIQIRLLAEAAFLAASADEPLEMNAIRRNALAYQKEHGCDLETAALRVFSNADGAYGSNVNLLVDSGAWGDEDELAEAYERRKSYAYGRSGKASKQSALLQRSLAGVQLAYQNLESVELGVTTIDQYFDTLGGIGRAVRRASGVDVPVYIGDQTRGEGKVRTLGEQVALESRTRMLNPKWFEAMLEHGAEGVRSIEAQVTNTMGWSATTGQVDPWIYKQITETFVLDPALRERMAKLNPKASAKLANRLIEAQERSYWEPDTEMLEELRRAGDELEDRLEGIGDGVAA